MHTDRTIISKCTGSQRDAYGFTLIEVMVGLIVAAVLGVVSVQSLNGAMAGFQASNTAGQVVTALHAARMKAISRHTDYKVTFYPTAPYQNACNPNVTVYPPSYQLYRNNAGVWVCDGKAIRLPTTVEFKDDTPTSFANNEVVFTPTGVLNPITTGTIYLHGTSAQQQYSITVVGRTGRIKASQGW